jgi:uncharacterized protein (TIGR00369 family)
MSEPKWLANYDQAVAERFLAIDAGIAGLPGYLGFRFTRFEPGRLHAAMDARKELLTPFGNLHGGVIAAFCDHVLGCVCYPHIQPGQWAATTEFKLNYLAPVSGGRIEAVAEIVSMTRLTAVVRAELKNQDRVACVAQGTVLIRDPK